MNGDQADLNQETGDRTHKVRARLRVLLVILVAILFVATMAPDVMTDDSAEFQVRCTLLQPTHPPGYPLLLLLGKAFSQLPLSTVAWRLTLMSVVFGIAAVVLLYDLLVLLLSSCWVAFCTALVFAVSHTFWMESLLPEAYSLNAFFNILILYLLARHERFGAERTAILLGVAYLVAFAAGNHQVIVLMTPFFALWVWRRGGPGVMTVRRFVGAMIVFAFGASIYLVLTMRMHAFWPSVDLALGGPSRGLLFKFTPEQVLKRFAVCLGYHGYQFPLIAGVVGIGGWFWMWRRRRAWWWLTTTLWLVTVAYALNFDSSDVYVFYIPAYIALAIWIGCGFDALYRSTGSRPVSAVSLLMVAAILLPPSFYWKAAEIVEESERLSFSRDKGERYYLYPPKQHAGWFGNRMRHLMRTAETGGAVLTDWNYYFTARYFQDIEHFRRDLAIRDVTRSGPDDNVNVETINAMASEGYEHFYSPDKGLLDRARPEWGLAYHAVGFYKGADPQAMLRDARGRLQGDVYRVPIQNVWERIAELLDRNKSLPTGYLSTYYLAGDTFLESSIPECRRLANPAHFIAESDRLIRGQGVWMAIENVRDLFPFDGWTTTAEVSANRSIEGKVLGLSLAFDRQAMRSRGGSPLERLSLFSVRRPLHDFAGRFDDDPLRFRYMQPDFDSRSPSVPLGQSFFDDNTFYQYLVVPVDTSPGEYTVHLQIGFWIDVSNKIQGFNWIPAGNGIASIRIED